MPLLLLIPTLLLFSPLPPTPALADTLRCRPTGELAIESLLASDPEIDLSLLLDSMEETDDEEPGEERGGAGTVHGGRPSERISFGIGRQVEGVESAGWSGSPVRWWLRGEMRLSEKVRAGLMMEKDAGERADLGHASGFLSVEGLIKGLRFLLGDYRHESVGGLLFGGETSRLRTGGGTSPSPVSEFLPHRSRNESSYFRGAAVQFHPGGGVATTLFYSRRTMAGRSGESGFVLDRVGLYRTVAEVMRRGGTEETLLGIRCGVVRTGGVSFSSTLAASRIGDSLDGTRYGLARSSRFLFCEVDAELRGGGGVLGIELARGGRGGWGGVLGWDWSPWGRGRITLRGEARSKEYWDYRQTGAESNRWSVECGAAIPVGPSVEFHSLISHRRRIRPAEGEFALPGGTSLSAGILLRLASGGEATIEFSRSFREEERTVSTAERGSSRRLLSRSRSAVRPGLRLRLGRRLEWRLRGVGVLFHETAGGESESGAGCMQTLRWSPGSWAAIEGWMTVANSPSYDCALYFFEPDPIRSATLGGLVGRVERYGGTCAFTWRGLAAKIFWAGGSRIPTNPAEEREWESSIGFRLSAPL